MKKKVFQSYNSRSESWVKFKTMPNGRTRILDVKESMPKKPFKGIPKR